MMVAMLLLAASAGPVYQRSVKKIDKTLAAIWPDQEIERELVSKSGEPATQKAFKVIVDGIHEAYFIPGQSRSKFDVFDYMVVFDLDGKILQPKILIYREDYGGEIASKRWLRQFIGLDSNSKMSLGKDVQNIAGATLSCESATRGFKEASNRIQQIINGDQ